MADDDRVQCTRCGNFRACKCFEPIRAGLSKRREPFEVGTALAELPQRCPAFKAKPEPKAKA